MACLVAPGQRIRSRDCLIWRAFCQYSITPNLDKKSYTDPETNISVLRAKHPERVPPHARERRDDDGVKLSVLSSDGRDLYQYSPVSVDKSSLRMR